MVKCESLRNNKDVQIHCNQEILKIFTFLQNNCQYIYIYIYIKVTPSMSTHMAIACDD